MHVVAVIDSLEQGGAERSLVDLLPHLGAEGVRVDVVTLRRGGFLVAAAEAAGARVTELHAAGRREAAASLASLLAERRPDLVHTTLFASNVAGRLAAGRLRMPVVTSLVNTPYGPDHRAEPGVSTAGVAAAQALDAATARLVRRFHANSSEVATTMGRRLALPASRIDVIPRGRDPLVLGVRSAERRRRARLELGVGDDRFVVVAVARQERNKGLDVLLDAVAALPGELRERTTVAVAGREGRASDSLRAQVAELERELGEGGGGAGRALDVRWLGVRDDVTDLLAGADVFVLSSRREGFPGVVVEALALQAPIVATAVGGTLEALGDGVGVVVPIDDPAALSEGIASVAAHPAAAAERAAAGRERFEQHFTTAAVAAEMAAFYRRALA